MGAPGSFGPAACAQATPRWGPPLGAPVPKGIATAGDPGWSRPRGCSCGDGGTSKGLSGARCAGKAGRAPTPSPGSQANRASAPHPPMFDLHPAESSWGGRGPCPATYPRWGGSLGAPPEIVPRSQATTGEPCLTVEPGVCKGTKVNPGGPGTGESVGLGWAAHSAASLLLALSPTRAAQRRQEPGGEFPRSLCGPFGAGGSRAGHGETALAPQQRCRGSSGGSEAPHSPASPGSTLAGPGS